MLLLILTAICLAFLIWTRRVEAVRWSPFLFIGIMYAALIGWTGGGLIYLLPPLAAFLCVVGRALPALGAGIGRYGRIGLLGLVVVSVVPSLRTSAQADTDVREDLSWLRSFLRGREVLADLGQFYQYYLGPTYAIRIITVADDGKGLLVREDGRYRSLKRGDLAERVILIRRQREYFFRNPVGTALVQGCSEIDRLTVRVFDCPSA